MCSVLYLPSPNWVVFNPVFFRVCSFLCSVKLKQTAESCILFFCLISQKSKDPFFNCECTQIKANLFFNSDYLHDQEELLPLLEGETNQVIAPAPYALTFKVFYLDNAAFSLSL